MLSSLHHPLIDDLGSIVAPCIDVYAFFYHGIGPGAQCLPRLIPAWLDRRAGLSRGIRGHGESKETAPPAPCKVKSTSVAVRKPEVIAVAVVQYEAV